MTQDDIRKEFPSWVPVLIADRTYAKPSATWLKAVFWTWFKADRKNKGLFEFQKKNDCDNFCRAYAQGAQDCHASTSGIDSEGLAVGEYWYHANSHVKGPHAIVVAFTDEGRIYIEPQTGSRLKLTKAEEQTCFYVRF